MVRQALFACRWFRPGTALGEHDMHNDDVEVIVIFRRFRRLPDGSVLDARKYGLRAWPIRIRRPRRTH